MTIRTTTILAAIFATGMATASWAQGGVNDVDRNGAQKNPPDTPTLSQPSGGSNMPRGTVGQGRDTQGGSTQLPSPNANSGGRPNNPSTGPTDRSGNIPSENR
jgi:hypothetical protein